MPKTVLVGVCAGIAIYKSCDIIRGLQNSGSEVKVVMTRNAEQFIRPQLFSALTKQPVTTDLFGDVLPDPIPHISLARQADAFLIAPCTANVMAKLAHGIADDVLSATALATRAPLIVAPAMNTNMYDHPATQKNMQTLREWGVRVIEAEDGYLACGDTGRGRLADVSDIVCAVKEVLGAKRDFEGLTVLITAGPTEEPIDAVRFISNPSSGKTGFALAQAAYERGANVTLVSGPVALPDPPGIQVVAIRTAEEMYKEVNARIDTADIVICAAAVSDFRPVSPVARKLKKGIDDAALLHIDLEQNPDILAHIAQRKRNGQTVVGFAAETEDIEACARKKLTEKHADLIVGNKVGEGHGFGTDENEVIFVTRNETQQLKSVSKTQIARSLLDKITEMRALTKV